MVQQSLVDYIESQLQRGSNIYRIKQYLVNSGYDEKEVEDAITYVENLYVAPSKAVEQRVHHLSEYLQQQIRAGYTLEQLQNFLLNQGYPFQEVQQAINIVEAEIPKKAGKRVAITASISVAVIILIVVSITLFTRLEVKEAKLLDIKLKKLTTLPVPGEELTIQVDLFNFGAQKRYDVQLEYKIIDRSTNAVVVSQAETIAVETSLSHVVTIDLPQDLSAGEYLFRADARYDDESARAGFVFKIYEKEEKIEKIEQVKPVKPEELEEEPELIPEIPPEEPRVPEVPEEELPEQAPEAPPIISPEKPEYPFEGMSREQAFDLIQRTAVRDQERAIEMCNSFTYEGTIETCLTELALFKEDGAICEEIKDIHDKDSCYLQLFINSNNQQFCGNIISEQIKTSCELLSSINTAQTLIEQNRTSEIAGLFGINTTS